MPCWVMSWASEGSQSPGARLPWAIWSRRACAVALVLSLAVAVLAMAHSRLHFSFSFVSVDDLRDCCRGLGVWPSSVFCSLLLVVPCCRWLLLSPVSHLSDRCVYTQST